VTSRMTAYHNNEGGGGGQGGSGSRSHGQSQQQQQQRPSQGGSQPTINLHGNSATEYSAQRSSGSRSQQQNNRQSGTLTFRGQPTRAPPGTRYQSRYAPG
jgi:hypothetical protein